MNSTTFEGLVRNGQLHHQVSLLPFEGRQVYVTVIAPGAPAERNPPSPSSEQPPEHVDVETEVLISMPRKGVVLGNLPIVEKGTTRPCLILPEELRDD